MSVAAETITKLDWLLVAMRLSSASYASTYQKYVFGVSGRAVEVKAVKSQIPSLLEVYTFEEVAGARNWKEILDSGALGRLRHVVVTWNVENQATRLRLKSWKTRAGEGGGGLLGNFVSHCFHYLEWF